jgi:hypothetical protein
MSAPVNNRAGKKRKPKPRGVLRRPGRIETVAARQQQAIKLRKFGLVYEDIAKQTGVSLNQAYRDVQAALYAIRTERDEDAHDLRTLELGRLDLLWSRLMPAVMRNDCEAIRAAVKVSERRARLLGLDAREQLSVPVVLRPADYVREHYVGLTDDALAARMEEMRNGLALPATVVPAPEPEPVLLSDTERNAIAYLEELQSRRNGKPS